jgi:peptidoglycan/xylan/chitin deacetylase (PgdA/CDA1 family)
MTLGPDYLAYPRRRLGYDHDLYDWLPIRERPRLRWPGGRPIAVWPVIVAEFFPLSPSDTPFRAPGHMQTAFPDYRHYTARDYGNRIGIWRLLDALEKRGLAGSVAMNVAVAERYPALLVAVRSRGHEIVAHSTDMNGAIDSSLSAEDEEAIIAATRARWTALGLQPEGWLSIARSESFRTPDLLLKHGFRWCADWVNDELPWRFRNGLVNLPLNHELSDRQIILAQGASADSWAEQILDAADWLAAEATNWGGRMLPLHLTPYIIGLPYRIEAFERLLDQLLQRGDCWFAGGGTLINAWMRQSG